MVRKLDIHGIEVAVTTANGTDFISLTDMLKAKDVIFLSQTGRGTEIR